MKRWKYFRAKWARWYLIAVIVVVVVGVAIWIVFGSFGPFLEIILIFGTIWIIDAFDNWRHAQHHG